MNATADMEKNPSRSWAAEQLGLGSEVAPQEAKTAFFQRLDRADFTPPEAWVQATGVLDPSVALPPKLSEGVAQEIEAARLKEGRSAIEDFASRYWDILPQERRTQWERLQDLYSDQILLDGRLRQLATGLDLKIEASTLKDDTTFGIASNKVETLLENMVEWFPLAPALRAARRRDWLSSIARNDLWEAAAKHVTQRHPQVAALDPGLLAFLAANTKRMQRIKAATKDRRKTSKVSHLSTTVNDSSTEGGWKLALGAIVFCVFFVRACANNSHTTKSTSIPSISSTPKISFPPVRYSPPADFPSMTTKGGRELKDTTAQVNVDFLLYPDRFNRDGSPKVLDRPRVGFSSSPGEKAWRGAGGKYRDELPASRSPKGVFDP